MSTSIPHKDKNPSSEEGQHAVNNQRIQKPPYTLKIDIFAHITPPNYKDMLYKAAPPSDTLKSMLYNPQSLSDLATRFRIMDKYEGLMHVLSLASPPIETIQDPQKAVDLAMAANDEMAELVLKYPDRFPAAVAALPMGNVDDALKEVDRAINDLRFRGVQIYTPVNDKPLDLPEFMPLYEKMSQYNLPILIHPTRNSDYADYKTEEKSKYELASIFGWPYETTIAMARLVFSGILEKYPGLKIITHHGGAMVPYFEQRMTCLCDAYEMVHGGQHKRGLTKAPGDYFKMFYNDTAIYGCSAGLMCAHAFFGTDHLLFGTDIVYDVQLGDRITRQTINAIEQMDISDYDKMKIFEDNARKILRLPV